MWRQLISLSNWRPVLSATNQLTNQILARSFSALTAPQVTRTLTALPSNSLFRSSNILQPAPVLLSFERGFKVKGRLRRRCKDCYFVMREGRLYNICKTHPRHKQMSMVKKEKNTWILTDATQSKTRACDVTPFKESFWWILLEKQRFRMSHIFARVFKQAQITFDRNNQQILARNLNLLKNLVSELSIIDLGLNPELASKRAFTSPDKAPCTYISIHENPEFTMSLFILRDSYTMPIHDHPRMNGILKIVSGSVRIQSYTRINPGNSEILVKSEPLQEISATDAVTSILSPEECNYHEITAIDGPAAFFDILSPPYSEYDYQNRDEHRRQCHFYSKSVKDSENQILKLDIIPVPSHYICDSVRYNFPFE